MNKTSARVLIALLVAIAALFVLSPIARPQIQVAPPLTPVGASASGPTSTVWFHQPSSNTVVACQAVSSGSAAISGIQCASTRLP